VKYFLEVFPILRDKSYLILTNCEDADRDDLNDWIKEMGSNDTFKYFLDNKKILTTGCIDRANYLKKRRSVISDIYQNIVGLREKILDIIINCEKQYQIDVIRQGKALKESMDMELKKFKQIKENIKEKMNLDDYLHYQDLKSSYNRIINNKLYVFELEKNKELKPLLDYFDKLKFNKDIIDEYKERVNKDKNESLKK